MKIEIFSIDTDIVIDSKFVTGKTDYQFAIEILYPLISKLEIQRKLQNKSFYKRLRHDILRGCIMPPLTLAFIADKESLPNELQQAQEFINQNIGNTFILDGIQRINALYLTYQQPELQLPFPSDRPLFVNIIICKSMDNLLYRMITLNNGQRPMTANHQIEILLGNIFKFDNLDVKIQTEKERGKVGKIENSFQKSTIIKSYLAFLSNSIAIDNKKIIESKLDDLIAMKIIESDITEDGMEYYDVIAFVNRMSESKYLKDWFGNENNLIGFSVGIRSSFTLIKDTSILIFENAVKEFETAFKALNLSAIKLSKERRSLTKYFISNFQKISEMDNLQLLDELNEKIL